MPTDTSTFPAQYRKLQRYYQRHAPLYDLTRWTFLFGRRNLIDLLPASLAEGHIVEVGCGTGFLLEKLSRRFPGARITGIDVAPDMLNQARRRLESATNVELIKKPYGDASSPTVNADAIIFSYALTMMGDNMETVLNQARKDLKPGGWIGVADFHRAGTPLFRRWMHRNHVTMQGKVLNALGNHFESRHQAVKPVYAGLWSYLLYLGQVK